MLSTHNLNVFKRLPCNFYVLTYLFAFILQCPITLSSTQPETLGIYMKRSPESIVAPKGDEVLFECELNLTPDRLEWRFRHITASSSKNEFSYLHEKNGYNVSHQDGMSKLRIYVSPGTLGDYQCVAWFGSAAIASVTARLTLASISLDEPNGGGKHTNHQEQIQRWKVAPNNSVLIKCGNVISNLQPVWSFYKNNVLIPQSDLQLPSGGLVLNSVTSRDSGQYSCSAVNSITGTEVQLHKKINLTVEHMSRVAPYFLSAPPSQFSIGIGKTVVLECPGVGNPPPTAVWSRPNGIIPSERVTIFSYGLQIVNVNSTDAGTYVCKLDNGISPFLVHTVKLDVLEQPVILKGPPATLTNESESLELECVAKGSPKPKVYWMINGENTAWDPLIKHEGNRMFIRSVEKRHAGIVQCFAVNDVGETSESNLLKVNPKQIPGEIGLPPLGPFPTKSTHDHPGKQNKGRKKHKLANMIPPSQPNVTRLSDDSVMLRWHVPKNNGLPITFFKVQYRMVGDASKKIPRENWQTTNDDIPYGKRGKNSDVIKNFTTSVTGLKPDKYYKFRIIAVYSNNDNKEGNSSEKFLLQRGTKSHLPAPVLTKVEGISETAIVLHWSFPYNKSNPVDGFYIYYRSTSTAGEYLKATVVGMHARHFKIDMLEPGTSYEFKLQSFTSSAASEFSSILVGKTLKPPGAPSQIAPSMIPAEKASEDNNSMFPLIVGASVFGFILLVAAIAACFCVKKKRKSTQPEVDEDKPQLDHIQADGSHFLPSSVMSNQHHKASHRINGVMPRMNITPNPLAQEGDKNRNVMELRFMPTTGGTNHHQVGTPSPTSPGPPSGGGSSSQVHHHHHQSSPVSGIPVPIPHQHHTTHPQQSQSYHPPQTPTMLQKQQQQHQQQQQQQQQQQNNNHHPHHFQAPLTPLLDQHRRTLERSTRNLHYPAPPGTTLDGAADGMPTRIPSLRRTRRTSGSSSNNMGGVGVPGSPRVQRSPMPARAAMAAAAIKRGRLGSHNENMSSGSLNSIEV